MTISNTSRTAGPFIGNGVTKDFPFSYKVFAREDVMVAVTVTATGLETLLVLDSDYTVQLNSNQNANPGGVISLTNALPVGSTLAATSNVSIIQALDLTNNGGFYPRAINDALDKVVINVQQLAARIGLGALNVGAAASIARVLGFIDQLATGVGATLVGFVQSIAGSVARTVQDRLRDTVSVKDFGALGDGIEVAKNNNAWQKIEAYVNAFPSSTFEPIGIFIPDGHYKYSYTPTFTRPVRIFSNGGATLDYTGTGEAIVLGNKTQTSALPGTNDYYEIDNVNFVGAASATYGIYVANWVLQARISNCRFLNFGGPNMYAVTFQGNNWSIDLLDNRYLTTDSAGFPRHFCRVFGVSKTASAGTISAGQVVNGNYDGGNSRLNALNNWVRFGGDTPGIGYVITGVKSRIVGGGVESPSVGVHCDGTGIALFDVEISQYFETPFGYACIQAAGNVAGLNVHDCYANMHNDSFYNSTAKFFTYNGVDANITSATFRDLVILNASKYPLVTLRDAANQYANNFAGRILTNAPLLCAMGSNYSMGYIGYSPKYHNPDLLGGLDTSVTTIGTTPTRISSRLRASAGANIGVALTTTPSPGTGIPPVRNRHFSMTWTSSLAVGNYIALEARMDDLADFSGGIATGGVVARYVNNTGSLSINATMQLTTIVGGTSTVIASKSIVLDNQLRGFTLPQIISTLKTSDLDCLTLNLIIAGAGHPGTSAIEIVNMDASTGEFPPPVISVDRHRQVATMNQWFRKISSSINQAAAITTLPVQIGYGWATTTRNVKQISFTGSGGATSASVFAFGESMVAVQPNVATGNFDVVFSVEAEN